MTQLQDAQKGAEVTSEATERELELEAQLVEARSIIQEQVCCLLIFPCIFWTAMMLNMVISLSQFQFIVDMHKW